MNLLTIYQELKNPTERRMGKVIHRSVGLMAICYFSIGLSGYFSTYDQTRKVLLERQSASGPFIDPLMEIAIVGILLLLFVHVPVNYHPWRAQLIYMKHRHERFTLKENVLITAVFVATVTFVSIIFPDITKVLSIAGGLCSVTLCFTLPTMAYIKLNGRGLRDSRNMGCFVLCMFLCMIGYTSVILTFYDFAFGYGIRSLH